MLKRKRWGISCWVLLFLLITLFQGVNVAAAPSVKLNHQKTTMYVGDTLQLRLKNAKKKVTWFSSNKKVATVSKKGLVKAKKSGNVTITAKCSGKKYKCKITVRETKLSHTHITMKYGESKELSLLYPKKRVAWFSSNQKIAFADGKVVQGRAVGIAVITAKCNGRAYTCTVEVTSGESGTIQEDGIYTSAEKVAAYIYTYRKLPSNFITKQEARALGWQGGSLLPYAKDKCIGGDIFSNYELVLPAAEGRIYYECDVNTLGALERGAERIVYSSDGLIYYTADHYMTFTQMY